MYFRVTCRETYFIEELLYADEDLLENCKDFQLIVCTLRPEPRQTKESVNQSESPQTKHSGHLKQLDLKDKTSKNDFIDQQRAKCSLSAVGRFLAENNTKEWAECPISKYEAHNSNAKNEKSEDSKHSKSAQDFYLDSRTTFELPHDGLMGEDGSCNLKKILQENNFILDIDMDFFSTQNPFKLLHTEVSILIVSKNRILKKCNFKYRYVV